MIIHFNYFYENHSPRIFHSNWYKIIKKEKEKKNHFHCAKFRRRTTQLCPTLNCPRQWFRVQHWDTRLMLILMYKIMQLQELFLYLTDLNLQKHNPPMFNQSLRQKWSDHDMGKKLNGRQSMRRIQKKALESFWRDLDNPT